MAGNDPLEKLCRRQCRDRLPGDQLDPGTFRFCCHRRSGSALSVDGTDRDFGRKQPLLCADTAGRQCVPAKNPDATGEPPEFAVER